MQLEAAYNTINIMHASEMGIRAGATRYPVWLGAVVIITISSSQAPASERSDYDQAWQFFQQGRYTEAISGFKAFLAKYPKGSLAPEARFTLARIEPSGNNAFIHYQFILDNYPNHPLASQASYATAQYYQNIGSLSEAKARYLATYSRYNQTAAGSESLYRLAMLAVQAESLESAEAYAKAFSEQYPTNPRLPAVAAALADAYQARGDTARARAGWGTILTSNPTSYEAGIARERLLALMESQGEESDSSQTMATAPVPELRPSASAPAKRFYLQVGAYSDRSVLGRWVSRLSGRGYVTMIDSSEAIAKGIWKLRLGPYADRDEASSMARKLKSAEGLESIIVEVR